MHCISLITVIIQNCPLIILRLVIKHVYHFLICLIVHNFLGICNICAKVSGTCKEMHIKNGLK